MKQHTDTAPIPQHFFIDSSGALHDTRVVNWHSRPIRKDYARHHVDIKTAAQFKSTLRAGQYAWPGGYQLFLLTWDGAALCFKCAKDNARNIISAIQDKRNDGWQCVACDTNYEDDSLVCDNCNQAIPAAYGDPDRVTDI